MVALAVLVVIFLILLTIGLIFYVGFFVLNKIFLNKLMKLMERYNSLSSSIHSINFFKITILINSELPIKGNLLELKDLYVKLKENTTKIYDNLAVISSEVDSMNFKSCLTHLNKASQDLKIAENDLMVIQKVYDQYTSYGDAIDNIAQYYETIYEQLATFYANNVTYAKRFKPVIQLLESISMTISHIPSFKNKFDFKKTVNVLLDLRKKILVLAESLDAIVKFQVVAKYLKDSFDNSQLNINKFFTTIDTHDLQMIKKQEYYYKESYMKFMTSYFSLDLTQAKKYALQAINATYQLANFVYVHSTTQSLIDVSISEIEKQTLTILENKNEIKQSLQVVSKYFIKDPVLTKTFKQIANDIDIIERLSLSSKAINSKTFLQKLTAMNQIATISKHIYEMKQQVKENIEIINITLANVIQIVTELNDLYIYFIQLLNLIKKLSPNDSKTNDIEVLINNNLNLLNDYAKQVIENEHPDYKAICSDSINMNQNVDQLTNRIKTSILLKSYSTKLIVYCNRYKTNKEYINILDNIAKLHENKQYIECIEQLIMFIKTIKSQKKIKQ